MNWRFVDMDPCFLSSLGNIADFIERSSSFTQTRHTPRPES
ncbi:hypothetical protein NID80_09160 [Paraburkholderia megapolitana]|nr:hypothetical protein [Paraburkholderia sp. CHISQ3]MDQ6494176.1 hypothetical protein [Paraburkholderia megapolitana]